MSTFRALLTEIVDYAGLFPPAKLPLDRAIHLYAEYRLDRDSWMLRRFLCPAERLAELATFVPQLFTPKSRLSISVLGGGGRNVAELLAGLRSDTDTVAAFHDRHSDRVDVEAVEIRVPADLLGTGSRNAAHAFLVEAGRIVQARFPNVVAYYELSSGPDWKSSVSALSAALAGALHPAGFKLRCGGLETADFPSPEKVAFTIAACRDHRVPLKFTAGLHHPIRHVDAGVQTYMHGFLNVFTAGVLAHARQLTEDQVQRIIEDEHSEDFAFDRTSLRWKDLSANAAEIKAARQSAVISFGSCSFDEPRDGLRALGLLNADGPL